MRGIKLLRQRQRLKGKAKIYTYRKKFLEVYNSKRDYTEPMKNEVTSGK